MLAVLVSLVSAMPPPDGDELIQLVKTKAVPSWKRMSRHDISGKGRIDWRAPRVTSGVNIVLFEIGGGLVSTRGFRNSTSSWLSTSLTTRIDRHLAPLDDSGNSTAEPIPNWAEQTLFDIISAPYCIYGVPLFNLLDDPKFVVTSAERVVHNGLPRVKLSFIQNGEQSPEPRRFYTDGWCLLDESADWAVTEFSIRSPAYKHSGGKVFPAEMHRVIEYAALVSGEPVVKSVRSLSKDGKETERYDVEFAAAPADQITHRTGLLHHPACWPVVAFAVIVAVFIMGKSIKNRRMQSSL